MDRHTNVFFELNGSGKTSLLRILESTMSGYPATLSRVPFTRVEVVSDSNDYQQQFTRVIENPKLINRVSLLRVPAVRQVR